MKILYIAEKIPYPIYEDGGTLMNYHVLKGFKKNHNIDFLSFSRENVPPTFLNELCNNHYGVSQNTKLNKYHYLKGSIALLPPFYFNKSLAFSEKLKELISKNDYDVVFIDSIYMDVYTKDIKHSNKVISLHDSLALLYASFTKNTKNIFRKAYFQFCSYIYKRKELEILNSYSKCFFVSDKDKRYLEQGNIFSAKTYAVPNGVNEDLINKEDTLTGDSNTIVFSGIMDYKPNIDAVLYFVNAILPLILNENPNVKFYIIGKKPTDIVNQLASDNVIVTGWVDDISEYICKGSIYISPLISGAGLKNKILEAMALRIAIVATSLSIDGLDVENDKHLYLANEPIDFANKVLKLMADDDKRNYFIKNSYELIINSHTWENILKKYQSNITLDINKRETV